MNQRTLKTDAYRRSRAVEPEEGEMKRRLQNERGVLGGDPAMWDQLIVKNKIHNRSADSWMDRIDNSKQNQGSDGHKIEC